MNSIMNLTVFGLMVALAAAQRPFYAGSRPIGLPTLASRFKDTETSDSTSTTSSSSSAFDGNQANRFGEQDTGPTIRIPVDALGDEDLVKRIMKWPKENWPFWLLNADHIERHRHPELDRNQIASRASFNELGSDTRPIRPAFPRSSFLGPLKSR